MTMTPSEHLYGGEPYFKRAAVPEDEAFLTEVRGEMDRLVHPSANAVLRWEGKLLDPFDPEGKDDRGAFHVKAKIGAGKHHRLGVVLKHPGGNTICSHAGLLAFLRSRSRYKRAGWRFGGVRWH